MTNQDYIREAVKLADGWNPHGGWGATVVQGRSNQKALDALAAQLVRQVDATNDYWVNIDNESSCVNFHSGVNQCAACDDDRTMNTIKAIVDSGVLPVLDRQKP